MLKAHITSDRIVLRSLEKADLSYKVKWYNDPEVSRTLILDERLEPQKTIRWFEAVQNDSSRIDWVIECGNHVSVGLMGLVDISRAEQSAEIYIVIGEKDYWGKGIMAHAETLAARWAFEKLGLKKIFAYVMSDNVASIITMKKLGFRKEPDYIQERVLFGRKTEILRYFLVQENFRPAESCRFNVL